MIASSSIFVEQSSCAPRLRKSAGLRVHRTSLVATRGKEVSFPSNLSTSFHKLELIRRTRSLWQSTQFENTEKSSFVFSNVICITLWNGRSIVFYSIVKSSSFSDPKIIIIHETEIMFIIITDFSILFDVVLNDILIDHPSYHYLKRWSTKRIGKKIATKTMEISIITKIILNLKIVSLLNHDSKNWKSNITKEYSDPKHNCSIKLFQDRIFTQNN